MVKIKSDINQQDLKFADLHFFSNVDNFHSLEVVGRVSETQLQVGGNSDWIILPVKGFITIIIEHNNYYVIKP